MKDQLMSAVVAQTAGGPMVVTQIARPQPGAGQVLVRIFASGVNPLDLKIYAGEAAHARQPLPAILGIDLAGVVEEIGFNVNGFTVGEPVFGMPGGVGGLQGSLAQFSAVDADLIAPKPSNISMRQAAALPLIFITAWEGLVDRAVIKPAQKVLIHGGAGGVGHIAIQIAVAMGATVYSTVSERDFPYIQHLGAIPINRDTPVETYVADHTSGQGFDIIYDTVGGPVLDASFKAVRRFGHVVSALGWGTHLLAPLSFRAASYSGVFTLLPLLSNEGRPHHGQILRECKLLCEAGKLVPKVDPRRFTLGTVADAYRAIKARDANGKLIVDILSE